MDVCICGAQVPFMRGGAELAMNNLATAFTEAGHRVELIRLPVAWDQERLLDAPLAWRLIPVDADLVVATNFPSYYVRHPRKVVWLFHQHRAAYDAAEAPWSDFGYDDGSLETQALLSDWDVRALEEARKIYTLSKLVANRLTRYNGLEATPLYHPPPLYDRLHSRESGDYVFCATRLESNKRPELMIEAMAHTNQNVRLVIAGSGSLSSELWGLAKKREAADRVELLGFVDDEVIIERYAEALAVIYVPFQEDYGYVTLQAFYAGKPVITASDSGGVLEWVEDGVTGIVTDGSPTALGAAIDRVASDPRLAHRLGEAGRQRVRDLSWRSVADRLVSS